MIERLEKYLINLVNIPGLSGHEQKLCEYMSSEFTTLGMEVYSDVHGNCIGKIKGSSSTEPVMLFAHMDSMGFLIKYIDDDGFLRLERLGGIPEKVLPATKVLITTENGESIQGVICAKSHHITPAEEKYKVLPYTSLFVDVGANSKKEVLEMGIDIGSPVVYWPSYSRLMNNRIQATAIDDRGGCAVLLELAQYLTKSDLRQDVYLVGTVQEEYNLRGAMMASRSIHPKTAIAIDCAPAADTPDIKGTGSATLGKGPVMTLYNFHGRGTLNGTIAHPAMVRLIKEASQKSGIVCQRAAYIGGLTDMSYLQLEEQGVIGIDMGFAMRYSHSPAEIADLNDMEALVQLLKKTVEMMNNDIQWSR